jgi:hypothetical protein
MPRFKIIFKIIYICSKIIFQVGMCEADQRVMREQLENSRERLMLRHMARIAKTTMRLAGSVGTRVLMWHDMLVNVPGALVNQYKYQTMATETRSLISIQSRRVGRTGRVELC